MIFYLRLLSSNKVRMHCKINILYCLTIIIGGTSRHRGKGGALWAFMRMPDRLVCLDFGPKLRGAKAPPLDLSMHSSQSFNGTFFSLKLDLTTTTLDWQQLFVNKKGNMRRNLAVVVE